MWRILRKVLQYVFNLELDNAVNMRGTLCKMQILFLMQMNYFDCISHHWEMISRLCKVAITYLRNWNWCCSPNVCYTDIHIKNFHPDFLTFLSISFSYPQLEVLIKLLTTPNELKSHDFSVEVHCSNLKVINIRHKNIYQNISHAKHGKTRSRGA